VFGTSSLVGARSLAETAKRLEQMALEADGALRDLFVRAATVKRVASACLEGAAAMQSMLRLELEHQSDRAEALARELGEPSGDRAPKTVVPRGDGGSEREPLSSFAGLAPAGDIEIHEISPEDPRPAPSSMDPLHAPSEFSLEDVEAGQIADELATIFRQEVGDAAGAFEQFFRTLAEGHDQRAACTGIERLCHTLKGAAATIGLTELSAVAAGLQTEAEQLVDESGAAPMGRLEELRQKVAAFIARVGVPMPPLLAAPLASKERLTEAAIDDGWGTELRAGPNRAAQGSDPSRAVEDKSRQYFVDEARVVVGQARSLAAKLEKGEGGAREPIVAEIATLMHRLKGSALVVRENEIARRAAELQRECEKKRAAVTTDLVSARLVELSLAVGEPPRSANELASAAGWSSRSGDEGRSRARVRAHVAPPTEPELWEAFEQECTELVDQLGKLLVLMEDSKQPKRVLENVMRVVHTLKGAVNTIGLAPSGEVLHAVEDFLERLLEAPVLPSVGKIAGVLAEVQAEITDNLKTAPKGYVETSLAWVSAHLAQIAGPVAFGPSSVAESFDLEQPSEDESVRSLPQSHDASGGSEGDSPERKYIRVSTDRLDALMNLSGELVVSRSRLLSRTGVLRVLQKELGDNRLRLVGTVDVFREKNEFANLDGRRQAPVAALVASPAPLPSSDVMRAAATPFATRFTDLELDRYEEIHILTRSLAEATDDFNEMYKQLTREMAELAQDAEAFGSIVSSIQGEVTRARMVPVETLFARLRLPVRDAAQREGKEVRVVAHGEEVMLDKTIADAIFTPMLHLVRNAVVHGIETVAVRAGAGKKKEGTVTLLARQESGQIVIEMTDDGAGLDLAALHARGVAMGLIERSMPLADPAVKDLVFAQGLSTKAAAGAVSGRGVGCDVVRRSIERLNGDIRVDTTAGRGTRFSIVLPITLAITKALIGRHAGKAYAIPLYFAEHILATDEARIIDSAGVRRLKLGDGLVPAMRFDELLARKADKNAGGTLLVLRVGDQRLALELDAVVAEEEIVVKSLGALYTGHPLFGGVTIRGTGELVLILDVPSVMESRRARGEQASRAARGPAIAIQPEQAGEEVKRTEIAAGRPARVLFVDDSLSVRKVAERTLRALGAEIVLAVDGVDALAKLREGSVDIIFTDLEMPRMHGYDLIRELRFLPAYQQVPIVVVSSRSGQKHQDHAKSLGATDYITKPFTAEMLDESMKRWVRIGPHRPSRPPAPLALEPVRPTHG
jgi:chemosensory pili system protein ChpA (sensor histidine kinase/response regulator)